MSAHSQAARYHCNLLLNMLEDHAYEQVAAQLQLVHLRAKGVIGQRGAVPTHVYFPCTSVFSVLAFMSDGSAVEVGTIGREGFVGLESLAGGEYWTETIICQIEGDSLRMAIGDFKEVVAGDTPLRRIAQRYLLVYLSQVSQSVACNRLHGVEARFARWILMARDRTDNDVFDLTQEFLAGMLGVQRPTVSLVAKTFQQAGLIRYNRGHIQILDRPGLEEAACECYGVVKDQFARLLGVTQR